MKRDMDLVRQILLATEALGPHRVLTSLDGIDPHDFGHHVELLMEAGLLDGSVNKSLGRSVPSALVRRLTWSGHDFLDAVRSDTLWKKAKESVIKPSASWTFDVLKEWLKTEIASGLPTLRGLAN